MNLVLDLTPELESRLTAGASLLGIHPSDYAVRLLSQGLAAPQEIKTGADLVAYWEREGLIGTRPDIVDVEARSRALREQAQTRVHH